MLLIHHVSIVAAILLFVLEVLTVSGDGSKPTNQIIKVKKVRQKEGSQRDQKSISQEVSVHKSPLVKKKVKKDKLLTSPVANFTLWSTEAPVFTTEFPTTPSSNWLVSTINEIATPESQERSPTFARFLSLFTVVRFKNDACNSGTGTNGTCYSSSDCSSRGGRPSGSCASGFGVCCLFTKTCSETTNTNCTYFQNKGYPSTYDTVGSCQLTVNKASDNVCQLRLDFQNFMLAQPESLDNKCQNDQFIVTGTNSPVPAICGINSGQHIYVDTDVSSNNPVSLIVASGGSTSTRSFSIKITQLECGSLSKAPEGCLQYLTGIAGTFQSFNYVDATRLMLSNTDYTVCIRSERNFCGIQYTVCPDTVNVPSTVGTTITTVPSMSFSVTGSSTTLTGSIVETGCSTDWITIPCATNTMDPNVQSGTPPVCVDRICGMVFNSVTSQSGSTPTSVNSYARPFTLHVHTNAKEGSDTPAESNNRGFCLKYVQQPCTAIG